MARRSRALVRAATAAVAVVAMAMAMMAAPAAGHGGGLHSWDFTTRPSTNYVLATCNSWTPISPTALRTVPLFNDDTDLTPTLNITGEVNLVQYQARNCTEAANTAFEVKYLTFTDATTGEPYVGKKIYGYGFTGNCSAPGDLYRFNQSKGDDRFNLMWWGTEEGTKTNANGTIWGTGPNNGYVAKSATPLQSLILILNPADSPVLCCDLPYNPPVPDSFYNSNRYCTSPSPPNPPSPPMPPKPPSPRRRSPPPKRKKPPPCHHKKNRKNKHG